MFKWIGFACLCLIAVPCMAQSFDFPGAAAETPAALATSMPELAGKVIAVYWEDDRRRYLDNLFRLQIVAGQYAEASKTLASLRALPAETRVSSQAGATQVLYAIFARAKARQGQDGSSSTAAFQRSFRETLGPSGRPDRGPGDPRARRRSVVGAADLEAMRWSRRRARAPSRSPTR